jgi:hypothetical protein
MGLGRLPATVVSNMAITPFEKRFASPPAQPVSFSEA